MLFLALFANVRAHAYGAFQVCKHILVHDCKVCVKFLGHDSKAMCDVGRHHHNHSRSVASLLSSLSSSSSLLSPPPPPPLSCDLFVCCVFVCHCVLSPSSSGDGLPAHRISHRHCRRIYCHRHRPRHRLLHLRRHLTPPLCNLFDCCLRVLVSCFKLFVTTVPEHFSRTKLLAGVTLSPIMVTSLHATPCVPYGDFIIIGD